MIFLRKENDAQMSDFAFVKKAPSPCKKSFFKKKKSSRQWTSLLKNSASIEKRKNLASGC